MLERPKLMSSNASEFGRAFTAKCSKFDALTITTQQIGYSLIHTPSLNITNLLIRNIALKIHENSSQIYYARFLQLIFSYLLPTAIFENDVFVPVCKLNKRQFADMVSKDAKKGTTIPPLIYPLSFKNKLHQRLPSVYPDEILHGVNDQNLGMENPYDHIPNSTTPSSSHKHEATSHASQKTVAAKTRKSVKSDEPHSTSGLKTYHQSTVKHIIPSVETGATLHDASEPTSSSKKKLILPPDSDEEDDHVMSSKFKKLKSDAAPVMRPSRSPTKVAHMFKRKKLNSPEKAVTQIPDIEPRSDKVDEPVITVTDSPVK